MFLPTDQVTQSFTAFLNLKKRPESKTKERKVLT